jgi:hypothetical protein
VEAPFDETQTSAHRTLDDPPSIDRALCVGADALVVRSVLKHERCAPMTFDRERTGLEMDPLVDNHEQTSTVCGGNRTNRFFVCGEGMRSST